MIFLFVAAMAPVEIGVNPRKPPFHGISNLFELAKLRGKAIVSMLEIDSSIFCKKPPKRDKFWALRVNFERPPQEIPAFFF